MAPPSGQRLNGIAGAPILFERCDELPLVEFGVVIRSGSLRDPDGLTGLARMLGGLLKRGARGQSPTALDERLGDLGARLSVQTGFHSTRLGGVVLARNLDAYVALVAEILQNPALRAGDLARAKRETLSALRQSRDDDRYLAGRVFRTSVYQDHPYGRATAGSERDIRRIKRPALQGLHEQVLRRSNIFFAVSGAVTPERVQKLVAEHFGSIPKGRLAGPRLKTPRPPRGRQVIVVDKPGRSQCQMYIGTLASRIGDADFDALSLGNAIFGGAFTSRLTQSIRGDRGWSYGASSRLHLSQQRAPWAMWTHPATEYASECAAEQLRLLDEWVEHGVKAKELSFVKRYIINGHCFDLDTASKRLSARVEAEVFGIDPAWTWRLPARLRAVRRADVNAAIKKRISRRDQSIVVVGSADELSGRFAELPGGESVRTVPYTEV